MRMQVKERRFGRNWSAGRKVWKSSVAVGGEGKGVVVAGAGVGAGGVVVGYGHVNGWRGTKVHRGRARSVHQGG